MKINSLEGIKAKFDGGGMFGHAPKALWSKWCSFDEQNRMEASCRNLLVEDSGLVILCDAAGGSYMDSNSAERFGMTQENIPLLKQLEEQGITEEDVDLILLSHLHFDHTGGIIPDWPAISSSDWKPLFPNAKYVISKDQFERAASPHPKDNASYIPSLPEQLEKSGRLVLVDRNDDKPDCIPDWIELLFSDGHTPGMMHACINNGDSRVFFCSDLIPGTPWLHLPIVSGYDRFSELIVNEKEKILTRAVKEEWRLVYPHDLKTAASQVVINDKGRFVAKDQCPILKIAD